MIAVERIPQEGAVDEGVLALLREVFVGEGYTAPEAATKAFTSDALRSRGDVWVATVDGQLAGTVLLVTPESPFKQIAQPGELEVHLLAVAPDFRRAGVGDALLRELFAEAGKRHAKNLVLSTQTTMRAAHSLYSKVGFERAPDRDWERKDGRRFHAYVWKSR